MTTLKKYKGKKELNLISVSNRISLLEYQLEVDQFYAPSEHIEEIHAELKALRKILDRSK